MLGCLVPERGDQDKLAKKLGVDPGHLSRVRRGVTLPGLTVRQKLYEHCGIAMQFWDEPAREDTDAA